MVVQLDTQVQYVPVLVIQLSKNSSRWVKGESRESVEADARQSLGWKIAQWLRVTSKGISTSQRIVTMISYTIIKRMFDSSLARIEGDGASITISHMEVCIQRRIVDWRC